MDQTANPSILKSPIQNVNDTSSKKSFSEWLKKNLGKIIIGLLAILVVMGIIFGRTTLFSPSRSGNLNLLAPRVNGLTDASLNLVADKESYKAGDQVVINVKLFTGGYTTDSTDLVVKYDPAFLTPVDGGFAIAGDIYSEYPALQVDKEQGQIGISGITVPGKTSFNGVGIFAKLYFTALKDGQSKVSVDFEKGATADSNVVLSGSTQDLLGIADNADILISGAGNKTPQKNDQSCQSFTQACLDGAGNSGTQVCTGGSTKNGSCSYDSRFTQSCGPCQIQ